MVILAVGLFLLTNLRADTELPILWLWMVIAGIGVGPSFALFAALVQNSVEPRQIGSATASLTFFQQIGGTIGLTIAGTLLADSLTKELPGQLLANGVPQQFVDQFQAAGGGGGSRPRIHRNGRPRRADPGERAGALPSVRRAADPEHRRGDPRRIRPCDRLDLLGQHRSGDPRRRDRPVPAGVPGDDRGHGHPSRRRTPDPRRRRRASSPRATPAIPRNGATAPSSSGRRASGRCGSGSSRPFAR